MLFLFSLTGTGYSSFSPCTASSKLAHGRGYKNCLGLLHWADNSSMLYLTPETKAWQQMLQTQRKATTMFPATSDDPESLLRRLWHQEGEVVVTRLKRDASSRHRGRFEVYPCICLFIHRSMSIGA